MHKECGHGLKRLKFLGLHQLFRELKIGQARGDLVSDALEQIEFFNRVRKSVDAVCQNCTPEPPLSDRQGHANAVPALSELRRGNPFQVLCPFFLLTLQIERLRELSRFSRHRVAKRKARLIFRNTSGRQSR